MYMYDKAHELAKALADSPEYKVLKAAKVKVNANPKTKEMLSDFKKKQFEVQTLQMSGQKLDDDKMNQIQSLYQIVSLNPDIAEYLNAEVVFSRIFSDIYKIIGDAVEIDLGFLE